MTCDTPSRQAMRALREAIRAGSAPPCKRCPHAEDCTQRQLACRDFQDYVTHDHFIPAELLANRRKRGELEQGRVPTRAIYESIYEGDSDSESET